jgi:hypothetical protein
VSLDPTSKKTKQISSSPLPQIAQSTQPTSNPIQTQAVQDVNIHEGKKVKPIFINSNILVVKNVISSIQLSSRTICKVRGSQSTQVSCLNIEDKKKLILKLKSQSLGYHTFTDPSEKPRCFVLKGFYHMSCGELLNLLVDSDIDAAKVTDLIRKDEYVMYLVHFRTPVNIIQLNHSHRVVDGISVKWENLKRSSNRVTQCYNCQKWGHSSLNCGLPARCVKCTDNHPKGECPRTTRDGDAKCCNCGESHSANHRGCAAYKKHIEKHPVRSKAPVPRNNHPASFSDSTNFPVLSGSSTIPSHGISSQVSFAQKVKESNLSSPNPANNLFNKLSAAQNKLRSLPLIDKTVELFISMVDELSMFDDHKGRLDILMKYSLPDFINLHGN